MSKKTNILKTNLFRTEGFIFYKRNNFTNGYKRKKGNHIITQFFFLVGMNKFSILLHILYMDYL